MMRIIPFLLSAVLSLAAVTQEAKSDSAVQQSVLSAILGFEAAPSGNMPGGWFGGPNGTVFGDNKIVHSGHWSARIERNAASESTFSAFNKEIRVDFTGSQIEIRGFLRTENVSDFAGLWMREDGESMGVVAFDNMQSRQLKGTTEWTEYSITLPVSPEAKQLYVGFLLAGTGRVWADDLQVLVDGKPIWEAPKIERIKTAIDTDHEFDKGSGVVLDKLTTVQIENLTTLGRVWGFLKYHHPTITSGKRHWDYELFRVLPAVLGARDRDAANAALVRWVDGLGPVETCKNCAKLNDSELQLRPELDWIGAKPLLGSDLSQRLKTVLEDREKGQQFHVSKTPIGNPKFDHESGYEGVQFPEPGFQLLGLFRFWNVVEYWSPYRDVIGENWNDVLKEFIPRVALAKNAQAYQQELMALMARLHDGHANLWSSLDSRPPVGKCQFPFEVRFIEGRPVVTSILPTDADSGGGLRPGDVITELEGITADKLVESWKPYYAASNGAAQMRDIARYMGRGECDDSTIRVRRTEREVTLKVKRVANSGFRFEHDLPGATFQVLPSGVAYLKLSSVKAADATAYVEKAANTKGLIIDIRNYPSEFMVFALGSLLVDRERAFARFTDCDLSNPGAFRWTAPISLSPQKPHYAGKVVVLVDEVSQSQAEYTALAFRAAGATIVGSTTAGADGNVSPFVLPGGFRTMISGLGVFYPDKSPTQRVGIVPDVLVMPSIAGIRSGRDEVLEKAEQLILDHTTGPHSSAAQ